VRSNGERQLTFDEVVVRVRDDFALEFHIEFVGHGEPPLADERHLRAVF
jgi:propanediol utilization protein